MKLHSALLLAFLTPSFLVMTSCGDDDGPTTPSHEDDNLSVVYAVSVEVPSDQLSVADVTVKYADAQGHVVTEAINGKFSKTITYSTFPSEGGFEVSQTPKSSADVQPDNIYKMGISYATSTSTVNSKGEVLSYKSDSNTEEISVGGSKVVEYITRNAVMLSRWFNMTESDGKITVTAKKK